MHYKEFRELTRDLPYFRSNILEHLDEDQGLLEVQLSQWVKKGYVVKLRRGIYTLSESERSCKVSRFQLANQIFTPSYVSLESALEYYGFIPERVYSITSVTTNKTSSFKNPLGFFEYRNMPVSSFTGFELTEDVNKSKFMIASKEKALLDFLFFATKPFRQVKKDIFDLSFRFQNLEEVSLEKLLDLAESYGQKKIIETAKLLADYILEEWKND